MIVLGPEVSGKLKKVWIQNKTPLTE